MKINTRLVTEFSQGIAALKNSEYSKAVFYFRVALNKHKDSEIARARCMAYLGLCEILGGLADKISLIEDAHRMNPADTNILRVLAYAYLHSGERQKGLAAIILGLKFEPKNPELFSFLEQIGYRKKSVIHTLDRGNKINRLLGKYFRKDKKLIDVMNVLPVAA